jgi:hypothetical protein
MTTEKLKEHKSPAFDQISAKWINSERRKFHSEIHKFINTLNAEINPICQLLALLGARHILHVSRIKIKTVWKKKDLLEEWMESIFVPIYQTGDKTNCSNYRARKFPNYAQIFIQHPAVKANSWKLLEIVSVDFDTTGQLLIMYSVFVKYLRQNGNTRK